jgi:hypothetical protein
MHDLVNRQKLPLLLYGVENDGPDRARHVHGVCVRSADYGLASVSREEESQVKSIFHALRR